MKYEFVGHASTDLAMQLLREGKLHECIGCAEKVVQAYTDDALAYTILGAAYSQAGDHGMAIAAFEKALAWDDSSRAHFNLGKAYEESGRNKNALEQYRLAADKDQANLRASESIERLEELIAQSNDDDLYKPHLLFGDAEPAAEEVDAESSEKPTVPE